MNHLVGDGSADWRSGGLDRPRSVRFGLTAERIAQSTEYARIPGRFSTAFVLTVNPDAGHSSPTTFIIVDDVSRDPRHGGCQVGRDFDREVLDVVGGAGGSKVGAEQCVGHGLCEPLFVA